jgi:hypothetical protein
MALPTIVVVGLPHSAVVDSLLDYCSCGNSVATLHQLHRCRSRTVPATSYAFAYAGTRFRFRFSSFLKITCTKHTRSDNGRGCMPSVTRSDNSRGCMPSVTRSDNGRGCMPSIASSPSLLSSSPLSSLGLDSAEDLSSPKLIIRGSILSWI